MENLDEEKILDGFIGMLLLHKCTHSSHEQCWNFHADTSRALGRRQIKSGL